jgi:hypothetical protein
MLLGSELEYGEEIDKSDYSLSSFILILILIKKKKVDF